MMSVKDYAADTGLTVAEILSKCKELGMDANNKESLLSEDDIIILDNVINLISSDSDTTLEDDDAIDEVIDSIVDDEKIEKEFGDTGKKQKIKKASLEEKNKTEFANKRKEMYKNKEKLQKEDNSNIILYKDGITVYELSEQMQINTAEIIKKLISLGMMVNMNEVVDYDTAELICSEYNMNLMKEETRDVTNFEEYEIVDNTEDLVKRPPVVTIMGHVDHGKTSLLDYIRQSKVVDTESGGITQHIGAYQVEHNGEIVTFIDTPGHAAFTEMRARGASVTDIVIIIVAADDGVMPQTKEAVDHALAANVPIIVAVNKVDKPSANIDKILTEMAEINITPESWGGNIPFVNISAKTGEGIDLLLETILVTSEMKEYKANPNRYAIGSVIESRQDKFVGGIATLLIQNGTLRLGDPIVVGTINGKVRTMKNDQGIDIVEAGPSTPVEITGISENPSAGDKFMAFETETEAKNIANKRQLSAKEKVNTKKAISLDDLFANIQSGQKEINVILKADVRGSEEAVKNALEKIDVEGVKVKVIRSDIGTITESDIVLANAGNALVIGFNVSPSTATKELAKSYNIEIRLYTIIYKMIEDMELAMKGLLDPEYEEVVLGQAEVRQLFKFSKVGTIAGSYVIDGIIKNNSSCRIIRDGVIIFEGKIHSIQREKDEVKEVKKGFECGITIDGYNDLKPKDIVESFEVVEVKK